MHDTKMTAPGLLLATLLGCANAFADAVWIDVRSPEEYRAGNIAGDPNVPFEQIASGIGALAADRNSEIVLYCRSGRRSGIAMQELQKLGYTNVRNAGGIEDARKSHPDANGKNCC